MESRKRHQTNPPATASVGVGAYQLEVGVPAGSFAEFDAARETGNARALAAALEAEPSGPSRPVAAAEAFNESAAGVTKRVEQADDLFRAAVDGSLHELDSVNAEIDVLLAVLKRLDRAGRYEEQLRLLRALHGPLALTLRWLDLIRALRGGLATSEATGDRAAEAWVRHELGAFHLASGNAKMAAAQFRESLRLKEQLGDVTGRCATRHNLDCAERDLARPSTPSGQPPRSRGRTAILATVPLVALVLGVAAGRFQPAGGDDAGAADTREQITTASDPRRPEAFDDRVEAREDEPESIPVATLLENDRDANGDELRVTAVQRIGRQTHGRVELRGEEVLYTPGRNYSGSARFRYRISDGEGGRARGTVTVIVEPVNDDPRARPDTLRLEESRTVDVLTNDSDVEDDRLVVLRQTDGAHGTVSCKRDGECTYTPDSLESGEDTFTYTVGDGNGGEATATVAVTAGPPPAVSIHDTGGAEPDNAVTFTITLSERSNSTVTVTWETEAGTAAEGSDFQADEGTVIFEPGETEQTITIEIFDDTESEPDETFLAQLLEAVSATLEDDAGVATIESDDVNVP